MNNGNPIEKTHTNEASHNPDFRRRRLLRGAIGVAPMVLTLRSGALAAATSCTGAKLLTTIGSNGKPSNQARTPIATGDICASNYLQENCPDGESKISFGVNSGSIQSNGKCSGTWTTGQPVAILSSSAASSLNIITPL
jgi:hypothetical protein